MKKTKLLSTISTLTLGASVAAFAASCSTTPPTPSIGELSIDATEVSLGGKTSLTTGDTLSNDLMVGDKATYVIKSTSKYSNVSWTLSGGTKTLTLNTDYELTKDSENEGKSVFKILKTDNFEKDTIYTIKAKTNKGTPYFTFKTKGEGKAEELFITATNVHLGGKTSLSTGDTLSNDLEANDQATFNLNIVSNDSNVDWTLSGGTKSLTIGDDYSLAEDPNDEKKVTLTILKTDNFEDNTIYTIKAKTNGGTAYFTFKTKDNSGLVDPSINVVPSAEAKITGGNTVEQPIKLGSFMLFDTEQKLVKTDESNNLSVVFTGTNDTGFTDQDIKFEYDTNSSSYNVTLKSGTANNETCTGDISVTWTVAGKPYISTTNLTISVTEKKAKTLTKGIYGPDLNPVSGETPTIPVIKESGIYLDVSSDSETKSPVNAKWVILGGGTYVELINSTDSLSMNGLKVNLVPASGTAEITVKAIPEDTSYKDATFTFYIEKASGEDNAAIVATQGTEDDGVPVLQYQSTIAVVGDTFTFNLKDGDGTTYNSQWSVTKATGGSKDDPADPSDIVFGTDPESTNKLTVAKVHNDSAEYEITATYGEGKTKTFALNLFAGALTSGTFTPSGTVTPQKLNQYNQLNNDLVLGDKFEISIDNYTGEIDHWTAEYENNGTYALPSFESPSGDDKTKATWTVNDLDMEEVPASSYIIFKAYKPGNEKAIASFTFQTKVHVIANATGWNGAGQAAFPHVYSGTKRWGSSFTFTQTTGVGTSDQNCQGYVDNSGGTHYPLKSRIIKSPTNDYIVVNNSNIASMTLNNGNDLHITATIELTLRTNTGIKIVAYSTISSFNTCDNYQVSDASTPAGSRTLTINTSDYGDVTSDAKFIITRNGEVCTNENLSWATPTFSKGTLNGDAGTSSNYSIFYDSNEQCWRLKFTAGSSTPTSAGSGTITFQPYYPGSTSVSYGGVANFKMPTFTWTINVVSE